MNSHNQPPPMATPTSTTSHRVHVPWERLAADTRLAVASVVDLRFSSSMPQMHRGTLPSTLEPPSKVSENVQQLLSECQTGSVLPSPPLSAKSASSSASSSSTSGSTGKRRRTTAASADTITYTPATHRISKAKKGKRVHACQFPGCPKVFTRAEHRRRHELNHNPQASFVCKVKGCGKGFHRSDLLVRHLEKHDLETQTPVSPTEAQRRRSSHPVTLPESSLMRSQLPARRQSLPPPSTLNPEQHWENIPLSASAIIPTGGFPHGLTDYPLSAWGGAPLDRSASYNGSVYPYPVNEAPRYLSPNGSDSSSADEAPCGLSVQQAPSLVGSSPQSISGSSAVNSPLPMNTVFPEWSQPTPDVAIVAASSDLYPINSEADYLHGAYPPPYSYGDWNEMPQTPCHMSLPVVQEPFPSMTEWK